MFCNKILSIFPELILVQNRFACQPQLIIPIEAECQSACCLFLMLLLTVYSLQNKRSSLMSEKVIKQQSSASNFSKKVKSPYTLQYLQFEQRLNGHKKKKRLSRISKLITNEIHIGSTSNQAYLQLAHQIKNNKANFLIHEKENVFPTLQPSSEAIGLLKSKINQIKNKKHLLSQLKTLKHSHQLGKKTQNCQFPRSTQISRVNNVRSRVQSQFADGKKHSQKKGPLTFLMYKRSKKQLSTRFTNGNNQ